MKITNLRPKEGWNLEQVSDSLNLTDRRGNVIAEWYFPEGAFDYDVVQPEYKVGDVVKVELRELKRKGFIYDEDREYFRVAIAGADEYPVDKKSLQSEPIGLKIVGLWLESGETK